MQANFQQTDSPNNVVQTPHDCSFYTRGSLSSKREFFKGDI